jgi:exodeoxyribonuclease VII large subunit
VAELGRRLAASLDAGFGAGVWVEGEVTGARPASSGHVYFTLKDEREDAAVEVAIYRTNLTPRSRALIEDGARIRMRGKPTFWAPRGRIQMIVDRVEPIGKGALLEALEKLKTKLAGEGLFALERKRALPADPRVIGVVTSAGGAVIHDICKVAFQRGGAHVLLSPAKVQGAGAAQSILRALELVQRVSGVDVVILGRGGGSADELMAFNDEKVVRAVAAARVPIVSAVGHEVDVTLTDFAADARAATPSQAAEMVVADRRSRVAALDQTRTRLFRAMRARVGEERVGLGRLQARIADPRLAIASSQHALAGLQQRLTALHPSKVIASERAALETARARLTKAGDETVRRRGALLERLAGRLDAMSPLKVLARGYAIATTDDGHAVREASDVVLGDTIHVRVHHARIEATVVGLRPDGLSEGDGS